MLGSPPNPRLVAFGRFRFDLETARLFDERDQLVPGPAKALETMRALIERRDRIVSKDELMALVWPDTAVEEANLAQQIFILRKLIGDEAGRPTHIATIARRGYRFVGHVADVIQPPADPERSAPVALVGYPQNGPLTRTPARLGGTADVLSRDAYGRGPVKRRMTTIRGSVQPGGSGSPGVDAQGRVRTTVFARRPRETGGYGIPTDLVRKVLSEAGDRSVGSTDCAD